MTEVVITALESAFANRYKKIARGEYIAEINE
jgi:hypothetical protein